MTPLIFCPHSSLYHPILNHGALISLPTTPNLTTIFTTRTQDATGRTTGEEIYSLGVVFPTSAVSPF